MRDDDNEETPDFAAVAYTPDGLQTLLRERLHEWRWAAFASVLVQRRAAARATTASAGRERVFDVNELRELAREVIFGTETVGFDVCAAILEPDFMEAFGEKGSDEGADADAILRNANKVMDFYDVYIELGQRAETAVAPSAYAAVLHDTARVVEQPLAGIDAFIQHYVDVVGIMPSVLLSERDKSLEEPVPLKMYMDNELLHRIIRQLDELDEAA
jgi:hypothetical protein